jgi:hypothetical protein
MTGIYRVLAAATAIFLLAAPPALSQKSGVHEFFYRDSPVSGSLR